MRRLTVYVLSMLIAMCAATLAQSQPNSTTVQKSSTVPNLIRFSGTAKDAGGKPLSGVVGITFALYQEETGGAARWVETQNAHADATGHYSVSLGAEKPLPIELFSSGEARWLGVQVAGQSEQARVLLLSVPYALKAADAETLGGKPASAFLEVLQNGANDGGHRTGAQGAPVVAPIVHGSGTLHFLPLWTAAATLGNSALFQSGTKVGIGTTAPGAQLDVKAPAANPTGIQGATSSTAFFASGVFGYATGASGVTRGVYGVSNSSSGIGVHGIGQTGGQFETGNGNIFVGRGVGHTQVVIDASGNTSTNGAISAGGPVSAGGGVFTTPAAGVTGVFASTSGSGTAIAGLATQGIGGLFFNHGPGPALLAQSDAFFGSDLLMEGDSVLGGTTVPEMLLDVSGNLSIGGNISKAGGSFKIDHPLDPANKYLYHSFVESPDMMNIYNGVASLDGEGEATVKLPDWFEALNRGFRYQLTAIGAPGPNLYVAEEVTSNHFKIAGGKPGAKVSWQVTGVRHDAWADAHRIPLEVAKIGDEKGKYLHPELFGLGRDGFAIHGHRAPPHTPAEKK